MQSSSEIEAADPAPSRPKKVHWKWVAFLVVPLLLVTAYFVAACMVFDFSKAAFPFDQNNAKDGRAVAFGPRPRERFCTSDWKGEYWRGNEWPFLVFAPICHWWCDHHGYVRFQPAN